MADLAAWPELIDKRNPAKWKLVHRKIAQRAQGKRKIAAWPIGANGTSAANRR